MYKSNKCFAIILIFVLFLTSLYGSVHANSKKSTDEIPPTAPTNLSASQITHNSVRLAWSPSSDNVGVKHYYIYMNGALTAKVNPTQHTVRNLLSGIVYTFAVRAVDAAGNLSESSAVISIKTLGEDVVPEPTPTPSPEPTSTPIPEPTSTPEPAKYVVGYYASWSAYSGFTPVKIKASNLTHINYAFANIGSDLKIALGDSYIDTINFKKLNELKKENPKLKTLISVGGWSWSGKFSDVALTESSRNTFAESCVEFIKAHGFDGIELDWEYPVSGGLSSNIRRPEDKQNFTLLLKAIREKLDEQGNFDGSQYLLTIAGASGSWYCNNVELDKISQYLDYAIIMTYDIHGTWDKYTDFNAPLYNPTESSPQYKWSVNSSVNAWIAGKFPSDKLVVGVPFYGYVYNSVTNSNNGLYQTYVSGASATYDSIASKYINNSEFTQYYHNQAMVPWLWNGSTFVTYDNEQSIILKAGYVKEKSLAGVSIWQLGGDVNGVLLDALFNGLK